MSDVHVPRARGVLVAHGEMARGMADAVRKISGQGEDALVPLSNDGRSPDELRRELEAVLERGPTVVFTDLQGGSCAVAAAATCRKADAVVVCGVNLPMLLDFVFHRDLSLDELAERLVQKGREGIRSLRTSGRPEARADASAGAGPAEAGSARRPEGG